MLALVLIGGDHGYKCTKQKERPQTVHDEVSRVHSAQRKRQCFSVFFVGFVLVFIEE